MNYNNNYNNYYFHGNYNQSQNNRNSYPHNNKGTGEYYEAVSDDDDECFGEDDNNAKSHQYTLGNNQAQVQGNQSSAIDFDFDQLPFVPKFSSEIRNTVEAAKISENEGNVKTPLVGNWGPNPSNLNAFASNSQPVSFSTQPVNCPYFPDQSETRIKPIAQPIESGSVSYNDTKLPGEINNVQTTAIVAEIPVTVIQPSSLSPTNIVSSKETSKIVQNDTNKLESNLLPPLTNLLLAPPSTSTALTDSEVINNDNNVKTRARSSWADENGDPIQGAFDNIEESGTAIDSCVNIVNNTKVEYVFHVKEKKSDGSGSAGIDSNCAVGSASMSDGCVGGEGIVQGTVISSLVNLVPSSSSNLDSASLTSQTLNFVDIQDNTGYSDKISDEYDQKRLYEASKNKQELSNPQLQDESTASTSAVATDVSKDILSKKKTDVFPFKRNNFINQQRRADEMPGEMVFVENEAGKSTADKALESQALNELLREVKQGAERARNYGALGWQKQPIPVVNKRFLKNTLVSTLRQPYKPPTRGGRFHQGLQDSRRNRDDDDDSDSSSSSRSSRSSSRSSRSYSRSSSSRSRSRSGSRRRSHRSKKGKHKHPWPAGGPPPPPNAYYDWAAYGFPWYDPAAAAAMYYGMGEGYPQMYSNDPQFWAAYRDFYGMHGDGGRGGFRGGRGFNPRGGGRGGWGGGRGRGRGGMMEPDDRWEEKYSDEEYGSFSRSRSRSGSPGSKRKGSKRSHSFDNSPGSSSNKGRKRRRSGSSERRGDNESESSGRQKPVGSKSGDAVPDTENQESSGSKSKSSSSKKKKIVSKKTGLKSDGKDGEENGDKDVEDDKKKKKHKKNKKHKKSKKGEKEDSNGEKKDQSLSKKDGDGLGEESEKKDEEKTSSTSDGKVDEVHVAEETSENKPKVEGEKTTKVKVIKKKTKKTNSDGDGTKKLKKKKKKEGVGLKTKTGKNEMVGENKTSEKSLVVNTDKDKSEIELTSNNDKKNPEDDRKPYDKDFSQKGKDGADSMKSRKRGEKEEEYSFDRSRDRRNRYYDDEILLARRESKRMYVNYNDTDSFRYESKSGNSSRSNKQADCERDKKRGGKLEEIERRLQERKANRLSKADDKMKQRREDGETIGGDEREAKKVSSDVKRNETEREVERSENNMDSSLAGSKREEGSNQEESCILKVGDGKAQVLKDGKGTQKKKKTVKKKLKKKLKGEGKGSELMESSGSVSATGTIGDKASELDPTTKQNEDSVNVKKKKKVVKRKSDEGGTKKVKTKKKKKLEGESSTTLVNEQIVNDPQQTATTPATQILTGASVTEDISDKEMDNDDESLKS